MTHQNVQQSSSTEPQFFYGYIIVIAAFCIMLVTYGTSVAFGVFFKPMSTELGWTRAMTSGAFTLSMVISGLIGIVVGGLTDKLGPRLMMTLCGFFIGLGYVLMSLTSVIWQLYLFFGVIRGIGLSGPWVSLSSTVARWFTKRRSMMTGIVLTGTGTGMLITPLLASWLVSIYDWRIAFIMLGILVLVVVSLAAQLLRRDPAQMGQVPYGESAVGDKALQAEADIFPLRDAVHTRQFWLLFTMVFSQGFCFFTIMVHFIPHATDLGISAIVAANILATAGGASIVGRVMFGNVADRIGNRQVFIIGFILISAALFWLVPATEAWSLYLFAVVYGFAHGGIAVSGSPLTAKIFGLGSHGLIYGFVNLGIMIGGAVGPLLAGYIFDVTGNYHIAFLICAAVAVISLISTLLLKPITNERRQNLQIT